MGTLRRRGRNSWQLAVVVGKRPDGSLDRQWITIRAESEEEARLQAAKIELEVAEGRWREPTELTTGAFLLQHWLPHVKTQVQPPTYESYERIVKLHIIPALGHIPLRKLQPVDIQRFLDCATNLRTGKPASARSRQYWRAVLHAALKYAADMDLLDHNPVDRTRAPALPKRRPDYYETDELERLLQVARSHPYFPALMTAFLCGLRPGELYALKWEDIDFDRRILHVRRSLQDQGRVGQVPPTFGPTKGGQEREVPLSEPLVAVLKAWRDQLGRRRLRYDLGLVFPSRSGWVLSESVLHRALRSLCRKAGIRYRSPHKARHTFATLLLALGVDLDSVSKLLGHSTVAVTSAFYAGWREPTLRHHVECLASAVPLPPASL